MYTVYIITHLQEEEEENKMCVCVYVWYKEEKNMLAEENSLHVNVIHVLLRMKGVACVYAMIK